MFLAAAHFPLVLHEAVLCLYLQSPSGGKGEQVWFGACANNLRMRDEFDEVLHAASGDSYRTAHHVDESHTIDIERTWILRKANAADAAFGRNVQYVMEVWFERPDGSWAKFTFYGVTWRSRERGSRGVLEFALQQSLRAQRLVEDGGTIADGVPISAGLPLVEESSLGFFREAAFVSGEHLLGHYRFAAASVATYARVIAVAGASSATLTLEINGVLTAHTLVIPAGSGEVSAETSFTVNIPAGVSVRWKCTAAGGSPPSYGAVMMQVQPAG